MRKRFLVRSIQTLLAVAAMSTLAEAGFVVTQAVTANITPGLDRIDLFAFNDGNGTGTQIKGASIHFQTTNGRRAHFVVNDIDLDLNGDPPSNGIPDTVDLFNAGTPNRSLLRVSNLQNQTNYVGVVPTAATVEPNPWLGGVTMFSASMANLGTTQASSGSGYRFARLFVDAGTRGTASGQVAGELGRAVPYALSLGSPLCNCTPVVSIAPATLTIDVRPPGAHGGSAIATALPGDADIVSLDLAAPLPSVIADNVTIVGPPAGPKTIHISGLGSQDVGTHFLPFRTIDLEGNVGVGSWTLNVIPEPASACVVSAIGVLGICRRRRR